MAHVAVRTRRDDRVASVCLNPHCSLCIAIDRQGPRYDRCRQGKQNHAGVHGSERHRGPPEPHGVQTGHYGLNVRERQIESQNESIEALGVLVAAPLQPRLHQPWAIPLDGNTRDRHASYGHGEIDPAADPIQATCAAEHGAEPQQRKSDCLPEPLGRAAPMQICHNFPKLQCNNIRPAWTCFESP